MGIHFVKPAIVSPRNSRAGTLIMPAQLSSAEKPKAAGRSRCLTVAASAAPAATSSKPEVKEGGKGGAVAVHRLIGEQQGPQRHSPAPQPHLHAGSSSAEYEAPMRVAAGQVTAAIGVTERSSNGAAGSTHLGVCRQAQRAGEGHAPPARHPLSSCHHQRGHHHCRHSSQHGGTTVTVQKKCGFHAHRRLQWQQQPQAGPTHLRWPPPVQPAGQAQPAEGPRTCRACTTGL